MLKQLGKLEINKSADYYETVVKALEKAGFVLVLECDTITNNYYIIADKNNEDK